MKAGEFDNALALEREIEERRQRISPPDWRLHYVNSINIARLQRRLGDLEKAEQYFGDAFATTLGARSESDAVHVNVILARLHAASGRHVDAFTCWMRAGLHWAASDAPEAIGGRIVRQILGRGSGPGANLPESVSASLCDSILSAAAQSGLAGVLNRLPGLALHCSPAPAFIRAEFAHDALPHAVIDRALLTSGLSVLGMPNVIEPRVRGEQSMRLRAILYELLEILAPPHFLAKVGTVIVDDSLGREMAVTPEELVADCVRLGVASLAIEGQATTLAEDRRVEIERGLRVEVGCAVAGVVLEAGCAQVSFKRYLPPILLTARQTRLLALVEEGRTVDDILERFDATGSPEDVLLMLRALEQERVVNIDLVEV
jgi:hypothetical protein